MFAGKAQYSRELQQAQSASTAAKAECEKLVAEVRGYQHSDHHPPFLKPFDAACNDCCQNLHIQLPIFFLLRSLSGREEDCKLRHCPVSLSRQ
eukprot:6471940-Amphidinium_carterae.1